MKHNILFTKVLITLFLIFSFSSFAQNEQISESLIKKIVALKEILKSGNEQDFFKEIGYPDYVKDLYLDYTPEGKSEFIAEDEIRIKKIFTHLVFDSKTNSFPKICFEKSYKDQGELTKECQVTSWDGEELSIFNSGKSFDLNDENGEVFEFSSVIIFKFDSQKNNLRIIEIRVAG